MDGRVTLHSCVVWTMGTRVAALRPAAMATTLGTVPWVWSTSKAAAVPRCSWMNCTTSAFGPLWRAASESTWCTATPPASSRDNKSGSLRWPPAAVSDVISVT